MALNSTRTFWNASVSACSDHGAFLVEFGDDTEVQGLIQLLNKGLTHFLYFHSLSPCHKYFKFTFKMDVKLVSIFYIALKAK